MGCSLGRKVKLITNKLLIVAWSAVEKKYHKDEEGFWVDNK